MKIKQDILKSIIDHAEKEAPLEACGYLAGAADDITTHFEMTNIDESDEHFSFDPAEQFQVLRQARSQGLRLLAVYHSHPHSPARPSQEDIKLAHDPQIRYVIISLHGPEPEVKSFKIEKAQVVPESLEVI